jgi:hypothetical protein
MGWQRGRQQPENNLPIYLAKPKRLGFGVGMTTTTRTQKDFTALLASLGYTADAVMAHIMSAARPTSTNAKGETIPNPTYSAALMPSIKALGANAAERLCVLVETSERLNDGGLMRRDAKALALDVVARVAS